MGSPDADAPDGNDDGEAPDLEEAPDAPDSGTADAPNTEGSGGPDSGSADAPEIKGGGGARRVRRFAVENRTLTAVLVITAAALIARLVLLGDRIAHFDEGRVAWWAVNYMNSGGIEYRFIIHGPLMQHVNRWVFEFAGVNDFTMRLPVAIIGGLLPLSAFLYREHLRDAELVGVAFFLAFNPVLVYYSRFYRSTLPVAAFGFVAFGLLVRFFDTRNPQYVYGAAAVAALMIAAKESAVAYYVTWLGAGVVVLHYLLFRRSGPAVAREFWDRYVRGYVLTRSALVSLMGVTFAGAVFFAFRTLGNTFPSTSFEPLAFVVVVAFVGLAIYYGVFTDGGPYTVLGRVFLALAIFLGVAFFFYAPRAGNTGGPGLWKTFAYLRIAVVDLVTKFDTGGFSTLFAVVAQLVEVTVDDVVRGFEYWFGGAEETESYAEFFGQFLETIGEYAGTIVVLSIVGVVVELFGSRKTRYVVVAVFAWGFVSIFGYPLGTDIYGGWITVNAVLPLALPAGVGLGLFYTWLGRAWRGDETGDADLVAVATVLAVFLVVVSAVGVGFATGVYTNDQARDNTLVQYAQPGDDMRPAIQDMRAAAADNEGTDVLFYGSGLVRDSPATRDVRLYPHCTKVGNALPLQWYVNATGSTADCARNRTALEAEASGVDRPPVVIAKSNERDYLEGQFPEYRAENYLIRTFGDDVVILIHPRYAEESA
jgi:uncharacterized protein (TIGR03663 family)